MTLVLTLVSIVVGIVELDADVACVVIRFPRNHTARRGTVVVYCRGGSVRLCAAVLGALSSSNANFVSRWGKETKNEWGMRWINDQIVSVKDLRGHGLSK